MMDGYRVLLAGALLIGSSLSAEAQGTYQGTYATTTRSGYGGGSPGATNAAKASSTSPSLAVPAARNLGTGQGRTEGAMGLSPQLQKEMGISRQQ